MRYAPIVGLVMVLALLAGALPAQAQGGNPAVTDLGSNIYLVDGKKGPIPNLLPSAEVEKIAVLQRVPSGSPYTLSAVSPDDQTVLATTLQGTRFMNLRDGSFTSLKPAVQVFALLTDFFWLDNDTLAVYAFTDASPNVVLYTLDRRTGTTRVAGVLPDPDLLPVFVSPNGRKVLLVAPPASASASQSTALVAEIPVKFATPNTSVSAHEALTRSGFITGAPADSRAREMLAVADLFNPLDPARLSVFNTPVDLVVLDTVTGERRLVTTTLPGDLPTEVSFSQDGSRFAITIENLGNDPSRGRYDGALLSSQVYRDLTGNLAPRENPFFQGNRLVTLDFASGAVRTLRAADGDGGVYTGASWSTDNQTLVARVEIPGRVAGRRYPQYFQQFRAGAHLRFLSADDLREIRRLDRIEISARTMQASFVSPDEVIILSQYGLDRRPFYYNLRSGEFRDIADRAGSYLNVQVTNHSRELVFAYTSFTDPVEIYRVRWDGTGLVRLTWDFEAFRQYSLTKQQPVAFTLRDGRIFSGVLIMPTDVPFPPKNLPIIVYQEGGPTVEIPNTWSASVERPYALLPNFGFGLLVVPLYGRYGVGPERFEALVDGNNFGQIDIDAMNEIVGQLRAKGWASKVGITGCSYGGYFTTQSVTRHPTTYDAAHTMCSIVDMFTEWSRGYATLGPWMEGLPPQAALEEYRRDSPTYNAGRVRTPLLAFHGTNDFLPITVMENFMLQVINNKAPAKLLKFQDADHGFVGLTNPPALTPVYELYGAQEQIIWFRNYMK